MHSQSVYVSWGLWNGLCNKLNESKMMCALKRPTNSDDWYSLIHFSFRLNIEGPFNVLADHLSRLPVNTSSTKPIRPHDSPGQFHHSHICKRDTLAAPLGHAFSPVFTVGWATGPCIFPGFHSLSHNGTEIIWFSLPRVCHQWAPPSYRFKPHLNHFWIH